MRIARVLVPVLFVVAVAEAAAPAADTPRLDRVAAVAPDVLCFTIHTGRKIPAHQIPYVADPADKAEGNDRAVRRNGALLGWLAGRDEKVVFVPDRLTGTKLDVAKADQVSSWRLSSKGDSGYRKPHGPLQVWRKSKLTDLAHIDAWTWDAPMEHAVFLKLPKPLVAGKTYDLECPGLRLPGRSFVFDAATLQSPAIHVTQVGFRPDDPAKVAFLSCWMGTGGGLAYQPGLAFRVLDDATGKTVFEGHTVLGKPATAEDDDEYHRNYVFADVHEMDFSGLSRPGVYRLAVEGVGCSDPFEIGADAWRKAFVVSARGYYHQRSGIELGPPYATFRRPRCFHPADGVTVYASTCGLIDSGNGLGEEKTNFGNLVAGKTDEVVPDAWGGYMDAGDWDRRIQHLDATRAMLELVEMFPAYCAGVGLNIPESGNGLPDLVNESLWNLDCYRRMQTKDGGIRGGIESAEHPRTGDASWQETLPVMAYAPDPWSSHVYAGVAARAAGVLAAPRPDLAKTYRDSAVRAMEYAERELPKRTGRKLPHAVRDSRNLAAAELFRLTGDKRWHDVFLETTAFKDPKADLFVWKDHEQRDAPWVYVVTDRPGMDAAVKANCRAAILREADDRVAAGKRTGYHTTRNLWSAPGWGALSSVDPFSLARAHRLAGDAKYLAALVLGCQSGAGANPINMCYTTGVGSRFPRHILHCDAQRTDQPAPPGITIYGPIAPDAMKDGWEQKLVAPFVYPDVLTWPAYDAYWDIWIYPNMSEYTVMQTMMTTTYAWGYLAAR